MAKLATIPKNGKAKTAKSRPVGRPGSYTKQQVIDALQAKKGFKALSAKLLGCHLKTVYNYINRYSEIAEVVHECDELLLDIAEVKLMEAIHEGHAWAICFYLKTRGKERGYIERQEITADVTNRKDPIEYSDAELAEIIAGRRGKRIAAPPAGPIALN